MMPTKDTHLEVGVALYPRGKILSLLSRFPGKFEKPLAITVPLKTKSQNFQVNKSSLLTRSQIILSVNRHIQYWDYYCSSSIVLYLNGSILFSKKNLSHILKKKMKRVPGEDKLRGLQPRT